MLSKLTSLVLLAAIALAGVPACKPADAATSLTSSPARSVGGGNAWAAARQTALSGLVGGLNYVYVKPPNIQPGTSAASPTIGARDSAQIGGGQSPAASQYLTLTGVIYTDLTTQPHAWSAHGKFATPSANFQSMGPIDTGGVNYVNLTSYSPYDATHLVLELFKTGGGFTQVVTSWVIDGNAHDFAVAFTGSTYYVLVDDILRGSTSTLTNLTTGSRVWAAYNTTAGNVVVDDLLYGYRVP